MGTSTIGLDTVRGKSIFLKCGHCLLCLFQSTSGIFPVTLLAVYALIFMLTLLVTLFNSTWTDFVSKVSIWPFKILAVTFSVLPFNPSSATTSALTYVYVLASSSKAFTFIERSPFFRITGTVRSPINYVLIGSWVIMVVSFLFFPLWDVRNPFCRQASWLPSRNFHHVAPRMFYLGVVWQT